MIYQGSNVIIIKSKMEHMIGRIALVSELLDDDMCYIRIGLRRRRYKISVNNLKELI